MKHDATHECSRARPNEYGPMSRRVDIQVRCEGDEGRWYLVVRNPELVLDVRVQIHTCPWCCVRLLIDGDSLSDRVGEPGSYASALHSSDLCQANACCTNAVSCFVSVDVTPSLQKLPCCDDCAASFGAHWRAKGRRVEIMYVRKEKD